MTGWRWVFVAAAVFNVAVGAALLVDPARFLPATGPIAPREAFFTETAALLILVFGLGYAMVARHPQAHAGIVFLGLVGKAMMPIIAGIHFMRGDIPRDAFLLSLGDLVFAALFLVYLLRSGALRIGAR